MITSPRLFRILFGGDLLGLISCYLVIYNRKLHYWLWFPEKENDSIIGNSYQGSCTNINVDIVRKNIMRKNM